MFDSQEYRQDRPQGLKKKTCQNLGLVAGQCNSIAACAYSLKNILTYSMVLMQLYMVCCIFLRPLFIFYLDKQAPNNPV